MGLQITGHYLDILGKGGVNKQASATVLKLLSSLQQFLTSLKIALSQGVEGTFSSGVHYWGEKYNLNMQVTMPEMLQHLGHVFQ